MLDRPVRRKWSCAPGIRIPFRSGRRRAVSPVVPKRSRSGFRPRAALRSPMAALGATPSIRRRRRREALKVWPAELETERGRLATCKPRKAGAGTWARRPLEQRQQLTGFKKVLPAATRVHLRPHERVVTRMLCVWCTLGRSSLHARLGIKEREGLGSRACPLRAFLQSRVRRSAASRCTGRWIAHSEVGCLTSPELLANFGPQP